MKKIKATEQNDWKPNPLFKGLPEELKDPKMYNKIEKEIAILMMSDHKHKNLETYRKCKRCQTKHLAKLQKIKEYGFKNLKQYYEWRKIMDIIKKEKDFRVV